MKALWQRFLTVCVWVYRNWSTLPTDVRKIGSHVVAVGATVAAVLYVVAAIVPTLNVPASWALVISTAAGLVSGFIHKLAPYVTNAARRAATRHTFTTHLKEHP